MTMHTISRWLACWAAAVALLLGAALAHAGDKLTLADGRVLEGEVMRELDGYVWFRHSIAGIETEQVFAPEDYRELLRDAVTPDAGERDAIRERDRDEPRARRSGAPRAAVISLGDEVNNMVGLYMTAGSLRNIIPMLEEEQIDIVVFRINSGGGLALEVPRLNDVIHEEYKPRFRTVAWIESAISAAAMTSHIIEEIYFMPEGNYGGATAFSGQGNAAEGAQLERYLYQMEQVSAKSGYAPEIMRSMQISEPLSVSFDERGEARWTQDESGDIIVNRSGLILTFNSKVAEETGFSRGTAATLDELARAMGLTEVDWVGKDVRGVAWPVSRAEAEMRSFRDRTKRTADRINGLANNYARAVQTAQGMGDDDRRARFVGIARRSLQNLVRAVGDSTGHMILTLGQLNEEAFRDWVDEQEELLRELLR